MEKTNEFVFEDDIVTTPIDQAVIADISGAPKIKTINKLLVGLAAVLAIVAIILLVNVLNANARSEAEHARYDECVSAVTDLMEASDYLTTESRMYTLTGDVSHLNGYLNELNSVKRRDHAVETLQRDSGDSQAARRLVSALNESNELAERELYAMRLMADATGVNPLPQDLATFALSPADSALSAAEKRILSARMLEDNEYNSLKTLIINDVDSCTSELIGQLEEDEAYLEWLVHTLLIALFIIILLLVAMLGTASYANYVLVMRPMRVHAKNIHDNEPLELIGARELRYVVNAYNQIYAENHRRTLLLKREAEIDALTNLLNRGSYDKVLKHHGQDIALLIIDVDLFKQVNDTFGHEIGDEVLKKVATAISKAFRASDYTCRIGGDEFAVIMTETGPDKRDIISEKLDWIAGAIADTSDGLPAVTVSVGVAFSALLPEEDKNIYHAADKALYEVKHADRNGYSFYGL